MKLAIAFAMIASMTTLAFAEVKQKTTEGKSQVIFVGTCNAPTASYGVIKSEFTYTVCQEYVTADYEVTGDSWNTKSTIISGTEKYAYNITQKTNGSSLYYDEKTEDGMMKYLDALTNCNSIRQATASGAVDIRSTHCAQ